MLRPLLFLLPLLAVLCTQAQQPLIDYSFQAVPPNIRVNRVLLQPDGKILVGGAFTNYAGSGLNNLVRLNADGTVDPSFNAGGTGPQHLVHDIALQDDGRIVIVGAFASYNGQLSANVLRLHPNGQRDYSFQIPYNSINNAVNAVALQADGRVVAAGDFFLCYGNSQPYIVRFNTDGALDTTFVIGSGFNAPVHDLLILEDQRILCAGSFSQYNGSPSGHVALLTPGGPLDTSMALAPGFSGGAARALAQQPDGKILVGGSFTHHNGQPLGGLVRLNLAGQRDPSFTNPLYLYGAVLALAVQEDGRILAGGEFTATMYNPNVPGPERLLRMHANGTRDDDYPLGSGLGVGDGVTAFVSAITLQPDGRILVGGRFGNLDNETQYQQLVRLYAGVNTAVEELGTQASFHAYWDLGNSQLVLGDPFGTGGPAQLRIFGADGRLVAERNVVAGSSLPLQPPAGAGIYLLELQQHGQRLVRRVLAQ
jgi:uncharacterized delta-60 repeat protein